MSAPTVRISEASHLVLKELAEQTGQTMMEVLDIETGVVPQRPVGYNRAQSP